MCRSLERIPVVIALRIENGLEFIADGFTDAEEIAAGTDPLDANSTPIPEPTSILLQLTALLTLAGLP